MVLHQRQIIEFQKNLMNHSEIVYNKHDVWISGHFEINKINNKKTEICIQILW